jgi:hypothetical protein
MNTQKTAAPSQDGNVTVAPTPSRAPTANPDVSATPSSIFSAPYNSESIPIIPTVQPSVSPTISAFGPPSSLSSSESVASKVPTDDSWSKQPTVQPSASPTISAFGPPSSLSSSENVASTVPTVDSWSDQYAPKHKIGTVRGRTEESGSQPNSLSPVIIVGVAATVASVVTSLFAGLFVAKKKVQREANTISESVKSFNREDKHGHELKEMHAEKDLDEENALADALVNGNPECISDVDSLSDDSGWSSSAGLSSLELRTATFDSLTDDEMPQVDSTIVNIKAVSKSIK